MDPNLDPRALAQQNSFIDAMRQRLAGGLLGGSGMVNQAANAQVLRPQYLNYVEQAQSLGQQPMPFELWLQTQRAK